MKNEQFDNTVKMINAIKKGISDFKKYSEEPKHYDKTGYGFNLDSRFCCCVIDKLSFDGWCGTYGSSSCYTAFNVGDGDMFKRYLVRAMNSMKDTIIDKVVKLAQKDVDQFKDDEIADLKRKIANIEKSLEVQP